jgi:hypothetical protein
MFCFVLATLGTASFADVGTDAAKFFGFIAAEAHKLCRCITDGGTFHIQLNATGHHFYFFFLRAGRSAMVTDSRTIQTGFNAGFIGVISGHKKGFKMQGNSYTRTSTNTRPRHCGQIKMSLEAPVGLFIIFRKPL